MSQPTMWQKVKSGSKAGFDKGYKVLDKLGTPVNRLSNKLGSEAFWPMELDKESDKAARILKSFCKDGFYKEEEVQPTDGPKQKQKVIQKIPESVIREAKGLAIFTTMRTGLWFSGAGGAGVLIARKPDGSWSPPSGIMLHTAGLGFLIGVDIYDCVIVINTEEALEAFTRVRCTLGGEISVSAGPVGAGGVLETEVHKRQAPLYTYLKSRGFYAGVQIDGTIVIERNDENERFYGQKLSVKQILAGNVRHPPFEVKQLMETLKAAQGDSDFDSAMLPTEPPPSDMDIEDGAAFGVPDRDDPDPYGVLALEKQGMSLREAGTNKRASWEQFSFNPSPTSPVHSIYNRQSQDLSARSTSRRNSWRTSAFSTEPKTPSSLRNSIDQGRSPIIMADSATQTDFPDGPPSPRRNSLRSSNSQRSSKGSISNNVHPYSMQNVPEHDVLATQDHKPIDPRTANGYTTPPRTPPGTQETPRNAAVYTTANQEDDDESDLDDEDIQIIEEPVFHSVQTVQPATSQVISNTSQVISKARIVEVPKRLPPKLPPRNPGRRGPVVVDASPTNASPERATSTDLPAPSVEADTAVLETAKLPSETDAKAGDLPLEAASAEHKGEIESVAEKLDDVT
ncbi:SH3 domain-containing YSC84-like protein 1 [Fulvia fulva]|nr:SH3 domain-containing YSC84-like protein 1 [Fulvia fulva]